MLLFHIPLCTFWIRNVHISLLNGALWDTEQVHLGSCEIAYIWYVSDNRTCTRIDGRARCCIYWLSKCRDISWDLSGHLNTCKIQIKFEDMSNFAVHSVPTDGLAPLDAGTYVSTMMARLESCVCGTGTWRALLISPWTKWPHSADDIFRCISMKEKFGCFLFRFHWSLFRTIQLTIHWHWFR